MIFLKKIDLEKDENGDVRLSLVKNGNLFESFVCAMPDGVCLHILVKNGRKVMDLTGPGNFDEEVASAKKILFYVSTVDELPSVMKGCSDALKKRKDLAFARCEAALGRLKPFVGESAFEKEKADIEAEKADIEADIAELEADMAALNTYVAKLFAA